MSFKVHNHTVVFYPLSHPTNHVCNSCIEENDQELVVHVLSSEKNALDCADKIKDLITSKGLHAFHTKCLLEFSKTEYWQGQCPTCREPADLSAIADQTNTQSYQTIPPAPAWLVVGPSSERLLQIIQMQSILLRHNDIHIGVRENVFELAITQLPPLDLTHLSVDLTRLLEPPIPPPNTGVFTTTLFKIAMWLNTHFPNLASIPERRMIYPYFIAAAVTTARVFFQGHSLSSPTSLIKELFRTKEFRKIFIGFAAATIFRAVMGGRPDKILIDGAVGTTAGIAISGLLTEAVRQIGKM